MPVPPALIARDPSGRTTVRAARLTSALRIDGDARRGDLRKRPGDLGLHPERAARGRAGDREDRGLGVLRRRQRLRVGALLGQPAGAAWSPTRCGATASTSFSNDGVRLRVRHVPRPPQRRRVRGQRRSAAASTGRSPTSARSTCDWNPVWDVEGRAVRRRLDGGGGDPVQVAALPRRARRRSGASTPAASTAGRTRSSYLTPIPGVDDDARPSSVASLIADARRPRGAAGLAQPRDQAVRHLAADDRPDRRRRASSNDLGGDVGVDVKYGITQSLTADFTYNTDFAQVEADEQQVNLTRFSLFFPEKREFFLENQGMFAFGGTRRPVAAAAEAAAGATDDTPILFYSRRIGLDDGRRGADRRRRPADRPRRPLQPRRAEHPDRTTSRRRRRAATNFSVVRVKRDILRRSSVGAAGHRPLGRRRPAPARTRPTASTARSRSSTTWPSTPTGRGRGPTAVTGDDTSYRAQLDYAGDGTACSSSGWSSATTSTRKSASCGATTCAATSASSASARGRRRASRIRKFSWIGSLAYIENGAGRLETRDGRRVRASSSRTATRSRRLQRHLRVPAGAVRDRARRRRCRSAATTSTACASATTSGSSGRSPATCSVEHGTFYSGHKTTFSVSRGRVNLTPQLSVEPTYLDQPGRAAEGRVHDAAGRLARHLHDDAADVRQRAGAVQLGANTLSRQRAAAVGVSARQRAVRGLQRAARHAAPRVSRSSPTARFIVKINRLLRF